MIQVDNPFMGTYSISRKGYDAGEGDKVVANSEDVGLASEIIVRTSNQVTQTTRGAFRYS